MMFGALFLWDILAGLYSHRNAREAFCLVSKVSQLGIRDEPFNVSMRLGK